MIIDNPSGNRLASGQIDDASPSSITLLKVFFFGSLVRCGYALAIFALMGSDGLKGVDSIVFAANAQIFADAIHAGSIHGLRWLGDASNTMPLFQWLITLPYLIFGSGGALAYVLLESVFDGGTCVLVFLLARALDRRLALPSAIVATLNPTQIVMSGLVYTDTPYTFFVALTFYCALRWTRAPTWHNAAWLGCAEAAAALIRVSIAPWVLCATVLLIASALSRRLSPRQWTSLIASLVIFGITIGTIAVRSYDQYRTFAMTPQGGEHFALWIIPLAKEAQDRTPFVASVETMVARATERFGPPSPDPFEQSRRYEQIGQEALKEIKLTALVKAWASGIFINLASPALLLSPLVSKLPRTGFYDTPGNSFMEKAINYALHSGNVTYSWLLILGTLGLVIVRGIQLFGLTALGAQRKYWPKLIFAASWIGFLLLLNGPIASPKYRLPLEPLFNVVTAAGLLAIHNRLRGRTGVSHSGATI